MGGENAVSGGFPFGKASASSSSGHRPPFAPGTSYMQPPQHIRGVPIPMNNPVVQHLHLRAATTAAQQRPVHPGTAYAPEAQPEKMLQQQLPRALSELLDEYFFSEHALLRLEQGTDTPVLADVESVDLRGKRFHNDSLAEWGVLKKKCPKLRALAITNCHLREVAPPRAWEEAAENLVVLDLSANPLTTLDFLAVQEGSQEQAFPRLFHLSVDRCVNITSFAQDIAPYLQQLPQLRVLECDMLLEFESDEHRRVEVFAALPHLIAFNGCDADGNAIDFDDEDDENSLTAAQLAMIEASLEADSDGESFGSEGGTSSGEDEDDQGKLRGNTAVSISGRQKNRAKAAFGADRQGGQDHLFVEQMERQPRRKRRRA
ncbi:unnamed protein product [Amoebophrya sp. A120]|nr:unnamed protein product [Amoebophrya sp. A120]|eukprot:GSA120T00023396001.1